MKDLVKIFNELKSESGRNAKKEILEKYKDNKRFTNVLRFVYDPLVITGISRKKVNKKLDFGVQLIKEEQDIEYIMTYLLDNNTGRDTNIAIVQGFIRSLETEEERELAKEIVTKTLKVGVTNKTLNEVYGKDFVTEFNVMLAKDFAKEKDKIKGEFYVTLKIDGNRCIAIKKDGRTTFFSRNGKQIEGLTELEKHFEDLPDGWTYDGELLAINHDNLDSDKLFKKTQEIIRKKGEKKDIEFFIFDTMTTGEFLNGSSKSEYEKRRKHLELMDARLNSDSLITVLPVLYSGKDKSKVPAFNAWAVRHGYEGVMINVSDGRYESKRSKNLLKAKEFKSGDGIVLGVYEGEGKNKGKLGGVLITYKDVAVRIGSGFSDEEREKYWKDPDSVVGSVAEYRYFAEFEDDDGNVDLRFATWKGIRHDKTQDDLNYE